MNAHTVTRILIPALVAGLFATAAQANPEDAWNATAGINVMHDSNLFRRPSNAEMSDTIIATSAGLKVDKPYSLQRFQVDANLTDYRFNRNDQLNYLGKDARAAWLWALTPQLHGNLSANYLQAQNSFIDYAGTQKNLRTSKGYRFDAEWEAVGRWRLVGGVNQTQYTNSQIYLAEGDYKATAAEYGVRYVMPSGSHVTVMGRNTVGEYENRVVSPVNLIDSGFSQRDAEVKVGWVATGKSQLNGRLGYINREHDNYAVRDFKGVVGSLDYVWNSGGKLRFTVGVRQDLVSYQSFESSYYEVRGWQAMPTWQISEHMALRGRYSRDSRDFQGAINPALSGREDTLSQAMLAVDWMPYRSVVVSTFVQRDTRNSNRNAADFESNMIGLTAKALF